MALSEAAVVAVYIVSAIGGSGIADEQPKHARRDQGVTLYALVEAEQGGRSYFFSDASRVRVRGRSVAVHSLAEGPRVSFEWFRVEPMNGNLSNTETGTFAFHAIQYQETPVAGWSGASHARADVRPTLLRGSGEEVGTMRYRLVADWNGRRFATPGKDVRRGRGAGGVSDAVHRVSIRRDDSYLGWLTEMYGQPYIWASAGMTDRSHQSERLEGSDCADFVTYGWRRLGHTVPYTWTEGLRRYARRIAAGSARADGVYVDPEGSPIPFARPGDLLLFYRHVGVLVADRGIAGVLDAADIMVHTCFAPPTEEPIVDSCLSAAPLEILRWKP